MNICRLFNTLLRTAVRLLTGLALALSTCALHADPLTPTREVVWQTGDDISNATFKYTTPASMYEHVRNSVDFVLYHGSRSNSTNTYAGRRGNDVDTASVLIAMYRSSLLRSRYASGLVSAQSEDVANWLGVKDIDLAVAVLKYQGIQQVQLSSDRKTIQFEHTWVQVQVPHGDYRGNVDYYLSNCQASQAQCHWIDVDPSWKLRKYPDQTIDVHGAVSFNYTSYYNALKNNDPAYRDKNPLDIYKQLVLDYLGTNYPGKTLQDVMDVGTIIPSTTGILPASLPYRVVGAVSTYDTVDSHDGVASVKKWAKQLNTKLVVSGVDAQGQPTGVQFTVGPFFLADLSTQRLTVTYEPPNGGTPGRVVYRQGGAIKGTPIIVGNTYLGMTVTLGAAFNLTLSMDDSPSTIAGQADSKIERDYNNLVVGGYYLIGTGGHTSNWTQVHRAADQLISLNGTYTIINNASGVPYVDANDNGIIDANEKRLLDSPQALDDMTGGLLYVAMSQYFAEFVDDLREMDAINHVITPIGGLMGVVSATPEVEYLNNTAFSVMPGGLLIDMKGQSLHGIWRTNAPATFSNNQSLLFGHVMSSLEHEIWQDLTGYDAISTVRGIQMALANGASLQEPLNNGSSNNMDSQYAGFQFTGNTSLPTGWSYVPMSMFGTTPATFSNANSNAEMSIMKRNLSGSSDSRAALLDLPGWLYLNYNCVKNYIATLQGLVQTSSYTYGFCDGTSFSGTPPSIMTQAQAHFPVYIQNYLGGQAAFDFFDRSKGFDPTQFVYRALPATAQQQEAEMVWTLRNAVEVGDLNGNVRYGYTTPGLKTLGSNYRFTVYLEKTFEQATGNLTRQSFTISNGGFSAGGGYVNGQTALQTSTTATGSAVLPSFNNNLFNDKTLVSQTNNDLIRTPSTADPVSTVTGNMYHDETDVVIRGRGLDYAFTRSYNSKLGTTAADGTFTPRDGPFGYGWTHSYGMTLRSNDYGACPNCTTAQAALNANNVTASVTYTDERGGEHTYLVDESTKAVTAPPGEYDTLTFDATPGQYTLQFRNGVSYVFTGPTTLKTVPNQTARLSYIQDQYNNRLTMNYDPQGRLIGVVDNLGISGRGGLTFTYDGNDKHIATMSDWTGRTWRFEYLYPDANGALLMGAYNPLYNPAAPATAPNKMEYTYQWNYLLVQITVAPDITSPYLPTQTSYTYYRNNRAFQYYDELLNTTTMDYDLYRQSTQVTDPRGFVREYFYDRDNGGLVALNEPDGAMLKFQNTADGLRYKKTDGLGYSTQYSYRTDRTISAAASNNFGRVSREMDPYGNTTDLDYGIYDQPTVTKNKRNNTSTRSYYATTVAASDAVAGKLQQVTATVNGVAGVMLESYKYYADVSQKNYGQLKQRIEYIDPSNPARQRITNYTYESANGINLQSLAVTGATSGGTVTHNYTYDTLGRVKTDTLVRRTSATNATPLNLTTSYDYDVRDHVLKKTTPRGDIYETVYNADGTVQLEDVQYKQPDNSYVLRIIRQYQYDAVLRPIQITDELNQPTYFEYDTNNNIVKKTDANGNIVRYTYDGMNRQTASIDGNGFRTEQSYDLGGNLLSIRNPNGETMRFEYDKLGRQTKIVTPLGFRTELSYDANGNTTGVLDANANADTNWPRNSQSKSVYRTFDELNRKKTELDALNGTTAYAYDLLGNITSITDAVGQVTTFVYDDLGRLVQTKDPLVETPTDKTDQVTLYDEAGNVLTTSDRSGRQVRRTYDVLSRLTKVEYLQDSTQDNYTYDAFGDLTQIANGDVTYGYTYSLRHEMKSKTDSRLGKSLQWTYDDAGNLSTKTDYQGKVTSFQYDSGNRLVAEQNPDFLQVSYHYDPAGRLIDRLLSNGAATIYQYDADGRLSNLKNATASGTLISNRTFQRDAIGNILQRSDTVNGKTLDYTYDGLFRLKTVNSTTTTDNRSYTYDAVGNRKTATQNGTTYYYCYNATNCSATPQDNRLVNIRTGSLTGPLYRQFSYDDSGRMLQKQDGAGAMIYGATYNGKGRPSQIASGTSNTFAYDANDYRIKKTDSGGTRQYHLEGEHLESTYNQSGQLVDKYLRGAVIDEIVDSYHYTVPGNATSWKNYTFHHDQSNSITALSGANGSVEEQTGFDPFGAITSSTAPATGNALLYTGREYDRDSGLYYYRARYYDPEIGRFISEDPKGFGAGINFYAYCKNSPNDCTDPSGLIDVAKYINAGIRVINKTVETHPVTGVPFKDGFADFSQYSIRDVEIPNLTGNHSIDERLANTAAGLTNTPTGYTWHHVADAQTMQLVPSDIHAATGHTGGSAWLRAGGTAAGLAAAGAAEASNFWGDARDFVISVATDPTTYLKASSGVVFGLAFGSQGGETDVMIPHQQMNYGASASGGYVLYPNKPNNNMMQSVYQK